MMLDSIARSYTTFDRSMNATEVGVETVIGAVANTTVGATKATESVVSAAVESVIGVTRAAEAAAVTTLGAMEDVGPGLVHVAAGCLTTLMVLTLQCCGRRCWSIGGTSQARAVGIVAIPPAAAGAQQGPSSVTPALPAITTDTATTTATVDEFKVLSVSWVPRWPELPKAVVARCTTNYSGAKALGALGSGWLREAPKVGYDRLAGPTWV